jgi:beta propeller repeat protein
MIRRLFISLLALIVILGLHVVVQAGNRVTTNSYEDNSPHIKGNYLVWQGQIDGDWEIFLYNVATGECLGQITANGYDDISPQTDGNYVVWLGFSDGGIFVPGGEIFLYDISTGQTTRITNDSNVDSYPQIADGRVVWASHAVGSSVEPGEIMLYDTSNPSVSEVEIDVISNTTFDCYSPRINSETVVWVQSDGSGGTALFRYDLTTGVVEPAPEDCVWEDTPQKDGNQKVLTRYDGNDREIYVLHTDTGNYEQITDNDLEDTSPVISGGIIAWVGGKAQASEIYTTGTGPTTGSCGDDVATGSTIDGGGTQVSGSGGGGGCFIDIIGHSLSNESYFRSALFWQ